MAVDYQAKFLEYKETFKKKWWLLLIEVFVIGVIIVADLVSKEMLFEFLKTQPFMEAGQDNKLISLSYVQNTGAGFGVLEGNVVGLSVITILLVIILFAFLVIALKENEFLRISITFIIAGGIGNVVDRLKLGYVRDFFQFAFWKDFPVFNVADIFVTCGGFMLIIALIIMLVQEAKKSKKLQEEGVVEEQEKSVTNGQDILDVAQPINEFLDNKTESNDSVDENN